MAGHRELGSCKCREKHGAPRSIASGRPAGVSAGAEIAPHAAADGGRAGSFIPATVDLFGQTPEPPRGPGRPPHKPTAALRDRVTQLHQAGRSQPEIAKALGLTIPTLARHYWRELESRSQCWRGFKGGRHD